MENTSLAVLDAEIANQEDSIETSLTCVQPISVSELTSLKQKLRLLQDKKDGLFNCEKDFAEKIDFFIAAITRRIKIIELPIKYQYFDIEMALSLRDKNGFPKFAIYDLTSRVCSFENTGSTSSLGAIETNVKLVDGVPTAYTKLDNGFATAYTINMEPHLPSWLKEVYKDIALLLGQLKYGTKYTSQFRGFIPPDMRKQIRDDEKDFDRIYILAKATWQKNHTHDSSSIVVGLEGKNAWFINAFGPTSSEAEIHKALTTTLAGK